MSVQLELMRAILQLAVAVEMLAERSGSKDRGLIIDLAKEARALIHAIPGEP